MIQFNLTQENIDASASKSYGARQTNLEPGWYTLSIKEFTQPITDNGITKGRIIFQEEETGCTFPFFATWSCQQDTDGWRVQKTIDLLGRIVKVTLGGGITRLEDLPKLIGQKFKGKVDVNESTKKDIDPVTMETTTRTFKNNDFAKGRLDAIILPLPAPNTQQAGGNQDFSFNFAG